MNKEMELLIAGLENARSAINLALTTIEAFNLACMKIAAAAKSACEHPKNEVVDVSTMGEAMHLCNKCGQFITPPIAEGEEKEVDGIGKDTS